MIDVVFKPSELMSYLNILIIPGLVWIVKVEKRLTTLETKFDMCFDVKRQEKGEPK